jgi:hypothetical protein
MKSLSKFQGWSVSKEKLSLRCNCSGNNNASPPYAKGPLRCGCTFGITLFCLEKSRYTPDGSTKYSYLTPSNTPHLIVNAVCMHGGNCVSGCQNRVATLQRGGRYVNDMSNSVCFTLANLMENTGRLSSSIIRCIVTPALPRAKPITKNNVVSIRLEIMRLFPTCMKKYARRYLYLTF